jgi:hypothetical protein
MNSVTGQSVMLSWLLGCVAFAARHLPMGRAVCRATLVALGTTNMTLVCWVLATS